MSRCEQGQVVAVRIIKLATDAFICDECDALWPSGVPVERMRWIDFHTFMKQYGLPGAWSELVSIPDADAE